MHKGVSVVALAALCVVLAMPADAHAKDSVPEYTHNPHTTTLEYHPNVVVPCPPEEHWVCNGMCAAPAEDILRQQVLDTLGLSDVYTAADGTLVYVCKACTGFRLKTSKDNIFQVKINAID